MQNLDEQHVFITGGASGIGLAMGRSFAKAGTKVTLTDFDADRLAALGPEFFCLPMDVRDMTQWEAAKLQAETRHGPVTILCCNAGIGPQRAELVDTDPEVFARMLDIKIAGSFRGVHLFGPQMRERGSGHIVITASMAGLTSTPTLGAYTTAKFGVVGMAEVLQKEMASHGVGVSLLCPGMVSTGIAETLAKVEGQDMSQWDAPQMPGLAPEVVGEQVVEAVRKNQFYILTHGERGDVVAQRHAAIDQAFADAPKRDA